KGQRQPLATALDQLFGSAGVGYVVVSDRESKEGGYLTVRPGREPGFPDGPRVLGPVPICSRFQGRATHAWRGETTRPAEAAAPEIPLALSNRGGGPVPVRAERSKTGALIPQTQYYLVYVDLIDPGDAIAPGSMAQVKIHCKNETCLTWLWRKINTTLE